MKLNALHMRFGAMAAGILILILGGRVMFPSSDARVLIEFGADADTFEGLPVEIDGKVVGNLQRTGQVTRMAFPVKGGDHTVRVVHPKMECAAARVAVKPSGKVHLMLEVGDAVDVKGRLTSQLVLRQ